MTNQELIDRALEKIGVVEKGASGSASESADALLELNEMMEEWRVSAADLNWFTQDTLSDTTPIPPWADSGIVFNLAVRCGPVFRAPVPGDTVEGARLGKELIIRTLFNLNLRSADMTNLPQGVGTRRSILTDA